MSPAAAKTISASQTTLSDLMGPPDANINGTVFGGRILALVDKAAGVAAMRHAGRPAVTVAMERIEFLIPIEVGQLVIAEAQLNHVGRTSMEVGVEVYAEDVKLGARRHTNSCLVTMVALDEDKKPAQVPALTLITPQEKNRHAEAELRRTLRARRP